MAAKKGQPDNKAWGSPGSRLEFLMMLTAKSLYLQVSRVLLCAGTITAIANDYDYWRIFAILWAITCLFGILMTVPVFIVMGIGTGPAQADWMSDQFVYIVFIILPTLLALILPSIWKFLKASWKSQD